MHVLFSLMTSVSSVISSRWHRHHAVEVWTVDLIPGLTPGRVALATQLRVCRKVDGTESTADGATSGTTLVGHQITHASTSPTALRLGPRRMRVRWIIRRIPRVIPSRRPQPRCKPHPGVEEKSSVHIFGGCVRYHTACVSSVPDGVRRIGIMRRIGGVACRRGIAGTSLDRCGGGGGEARCVDPPGPKPCRSCCCFCRRRRGCCSGRG